MAALERRRDRPCTHILSRGKPDVKPLRLYFWRVVIQSSGQGGPAPRPFRSRDVSARRGWSRSARPRPRERAPTKRGRTTTQGAASGHAAAGAGTRDTAPRHALPSPPQRTHTQRGRTAHALLRRRTAPPELPPQESGNDKKAGTNDHHPARHLGGVGIKSRQRPHPSQGTLVPASRRPHPPNDDAAASSRAERRASPGARISAAADGSSDDFGSSST